MDSHSTLRSAAVPVRVLLQVVVLKCNADLILPQEEESVKKINDIWAQGCIRFYALQCFAPLVSLYCNCGLLG